MGAGQCFVMVWWAVLKRQHWELFWGNGNAFYLGWDAVTHMCTFKVYIYFLFFLKVGGVKGGRRG